MNNIVKCPTCSTSRNVDTAPLCPYCTEHKEELPKKYQKNCVYCTAKFQTNSPQKIYCSDHCKSRKYLGKYGHTCKKCGYVDL